MQKTKEKIHTAIHTNTQILRVPKNQLWINILITIWPRIQFCHSRETEMLKNRKRLELCPCWSQCPPHPAIKTIEESLFSPEFLPIPIRSNRIGVLQILQPKNVSSWGLEDKLFLKQPLLCGTSFRDYNGPTLLVFHKALKTRLWSWAQGATWSKGSASWLYS